MSTRNDRGREGAINSRIVAVVVVVALLAGLAWYVFYRGRMVVPERPSAVVTHSAITSESRSREQTIVSLYLPANGMLAEQTIASGSQPDSQLGARRAVTELLADQQAALIPVLKDIRLRYLYLDPAGTAIVDLSSRQPHQREVTASAWDELLALYAVVNTIMQNFPDVKQVRFLRDGREAQTLAGHIDLTRAFVKRTDLTRQR